MAIAWAAADRAASYRVERQAVAGPGSDRWTTIATTAATTHDDSLVGEARGFRYRATPLRGRWIGTPSPSVEVTTPVAASFSGC